MIYDCCILLLFGTKSRPLCRNYNFELLIQKHDRAYSECKFGRKYLCDNEVQYSITKKGITRLYYIKYVSIYLDITNKTELENANLFRKFASAKICSEKKKSLASNLGGGGTIFTAQFVCWKSPPEIPNIKLLDHKKRCMKNY